MARIREKPDCESCRLLHEIKGKEPKCDVCIPILDECNRSVAQIWLLTRGQIITAGMGEVVDINHVALWKNIEKFKETYEIENEIDCFIRVTEIFHHFLEIDRMAAKSGSEFEHEAR